MAQVYHNPPTGQPPVGNSAMLPEERDRLVRVEEGLRHHGTQLDRIEERQQVSDGKLDELIAAAHAGRGAWWAILKIGGVLTGIAGGAVWVVEHAGKIIAR